MQKSYAEKATQDEAVRAVQQLYRLRADLTDALYVVRLQAVHALSAQGLSARDIAALDLGMSKSTIGRLMREDAYSVAAGLGSKAPALVINAWKGSSVETSR